MRPLMIVVIAMACVSCQSAPPDVVAMEKAALDRWGKGDPQGYLDIMANEITYFDPTQEKRVDGRDVLQKMLEPLTGKIKVARFDMIDPKVQQHGETALLTFNIVSYVTLPDGKERAAARWNTSELYGRVDGQWRIIHSHWSYTKPELKQAGNETSN